MKRRSEFNGFSCSTFCSNPAVQILSPPQARLLQQASSHGRRPTASARSSAPAMSPSGQAPGQDRSPRPLPGRDLFADPAQRGHVGRDVSRHPCHATRVTVVSRIRGTPGIQEVTGGREEDSVQVQGEPRGNHRTREDTALPAFGTVRPGSNPGPRPKSSSKSPIPPGHASFWLLEMPYQKGYDVTALVCPRSRHQGGFEAYGEIRDLHTHQSTSG